MKRFFHFATSILVVLLLFFPLGEVESSQIVSQQDLIELPLTLPLRSATIPANLILSENVILTGNGTIDPVDDGWLRLTDNDYNQTGYAYYDKPIPTNRGLVIEFDYTIWGRKGSTGGDGFSFFLFDGATTNFNPGGYGGSLGYAQRCGILGLSNGYIGIGFDEFGNFSRASECRNGGISRTPDSIVLRGPGNGMDGYAYLTGNKVEGGIGFNQPTRPTQNGADYRRAIIILEPVGSAFRISVLLISGLGTEPEVIIESFTLSSVAPTTLKFGFAGSTGSVTNNHEIRNLKISKRTPDLKVLKTVEDLNGGNTRPGDMLKYTISIQNQSNFDVHNAEFIDPNPANTTISTGSISYPSGCTLVSESPQIKLTGCEIPAQSQVSISYQVQIHSPLDNGTVLSNQASVLYSGITQKSDGDAVQAGEQPTTIIITAGPAFSGMSKSATLHDLDGNGVASPGDRLRYRINITNSGDANANALLFSDVISSNVSYIPGSATSSKSPAPVYSSSTKELTWSGQLLSGETNIIEYDVTINAGIQVGEIISNQGKLDFDSNNDDTLDQFLLTDSDLGLPGLQPTEVVVGGRPEGVAVKTAVDLNGGNLEPGDTIQYRITMKNLSGYNVNNLEYVDTIPNNTTYVSNSISIPAVASVISTSPVLRIQGINVPAFSQVQLSFNVRVNAAVPANVTEIFNQGIVYYDSNGDGNNDSSQLTDGDTTKAGNQPTTLSLEAGAKFENTSKTVVLIDQDGNGFTSPGDHLRYEIIIPNSGNQDAVDVNFTDPIPTNHTTFIENSITTSPETPAANYNSDLERIEWSGSIPAGSFLRIRYTVQIISGLPTGTKITNQGQVTHLEKQILTDSDLSTPGAQTTDIVLGGRPEGLAVKSGIDVNGGNLEPGDIIQYNITFSNLSSYDANNLEFVDSIPNHTTYVNDSLIKPPGSLVISTSPTLRIQGVNVPAQSFVSMSFQVKINNTLPDGVNEIYNQGIVYYDSKGDGNNDSNQKTDGDTTKAGNQPTILPIITGPNFETSNKSVSLVLDADNNNTYSPGDHLRYQINVANTGTSDAIDIVFYDAIPDNTTFIPESITTSPSVPEARYDAAGDFIIWEGDIPAGETVAIGFQVKIDLGLQIGDEIWNQGSIKLSEDQITLTDSDLIQPGKQPAIVVIGGSPTGLAVKRVEDLNGDVLRPGEILEYTLTFINKSTLPAEGLEFSDAIPVHTSYVQGSLVLPPGENVSVISTSPILRLTGIDVPALTEITFSYQVELDISIPAGVSSIINQGLVFYDSTGDGINDSTQKTDGDPELPGEQPTIITLINEPDTPPDTPTTPTTGLPQLPTTGFPPGLITPNNKRIIIPFTAQHQMRLRIVKNRIDIPILGVPLVNGQWNTHWLSYQAGYLEGSAFPTWKGNSIITAHLYLSNGEPGPFIDLDKLQFGDFIIIEAWNQSYIYSVRSKEIVPASYHLSFEDEPYSWVTLVTCAAFNETTGQFDSRLLVKAVLIKISD
jgi:LPXTG-site transpeptidase (sortase) family protein